MFNFVNSGPFEAIAASEPGEGHSHFLQHAAGRDVLRHYTAGDAGHVQRAETEINTRLGGFCRIALAPDRAEKAVTEIDHAVFVFESAPAQDFIGIFVGNNPAAMAIKAVLIVIENERAGFALILERRVAGVPDNFRVGIQTVEGVGIIRDASGREMPVRYADIDEEGYKSLSEGEQVEFDISDSAGGIRARRVRRLPVDDD